MHAPRRGQRGAPTSPFRRALPAALPLGLLLAASALGCKRADETAGTPAAESGPVPGQASRDLGRTYTTWLEKGDHGRLWDRFGPDMRHAFGTADSLRTYLDRTVAALGAERGSPQESIQMSDTVLVYTRVAAFEKAPRPMVLQWTLGRRGMITGFVMRPQPADSAGADTEQTAGAPVRAGAATPVRPGTGREKRP